MVTLRYTDLVLYCDMPVISRTPTQSYESSGEYYDAPEAENRDGSIPPKWTLNNKEIPFKFQAGQTKYKNWMRLENVDLSYTGLYTCVYKVPYYIYKAVSYLSVLGKLTVIYYNESFFCVGLY